MLAVDTETTGLDQWAPDFKVFMVQWADSDREYVCDERTGWQPFLDALADDDTLVFANASFDIHALRESGIVDLLAGRWRCHDVQTLARVTMPGRFQYKLEALGADLLGVDATAAQRELGECAKSHDLSWTIKQKEFYRLWQLEPELMERYGREDVRLTFDLWRAIWSRASTADIDVYRTEIAGVAPLLRAAERDGVLVDQGRLVELRAGLEAERDELRLKLLAQGLTDEALGDDEGGKASTRALLRDLLAAGVPLYRSTPKDFQLAVNKDALIEFRDRFAVVGDLLAWRGRKQVLSTYVNALEQASPRIHASFSQCEARTSRMSCRRPNMQNLPTPDKDRLGVRDVLVPAPGNAFVSVDYDSIEVRVLAHYLADRELTAQLDDGMDMHQRTAFKVAQALGQRCAFEDFVKGGPRDSDRTTAKVTTYTSLYGGGARLLSTRLHISVEEAAKIKAETLAAIPGYYDLDDQIKRLVLNRPFPHVVSILGRRLYVPKDKPYVAMNTLIQGSSAEIMKLGMIAAAPVLVQLGYAIRLIVHDELLSEGPAGSAPRALAATIESMENVYPLRPRLKAMGSYSTDSYGKAK